MNMIKPPDRAAQVLLIIVQNIESITMHCSQDFTRDLLMPMICRGMDSGIVEIQETVFKKIPTIMEKNEISVLKDLLLPRIIKIFLTTSTMSVKVNGLISLSKVITTLDNTTVIDIILPALRQALANDRSPAICMCVLGKYLTYMYVFVYRRCV
jgi:SCY1-like protein 2